MSVIKIRCDNAGENRSMERVVKGKKYRLDIEFEYTARKTLQQNYFTEVVTATIANRGRSIMNRGNVPGRYRYVLFNDVVTTATKLDMLLMVQSDGSMTMRCVHWADSFPRFTKYLRT